MILQLAPKSIEQRIQEIKRIQEGFSKPAEETEWSTGPVPASAIQQKMNELATEQRKNRFKSRTPADSWPLDAKMWPESKPPAAN